MHNTKTMRSTVLLVLLFCSAYGLAQGTAQDSAWIKDNYYKKEFRIAMRDGVKLFTTAYIPRDTTEAHPVLMTRTPYSCAPYGQDAWRNNWTGYQRYYFRENYIIVDQDVRGAWMSEGEFVDVRPFIKDKKKATDIDEAS